jgi:hypothetical protein
MKNFIEQKLTTFVRAIKNGFTDYMWPAGRGLPTPVLNQCISLNRR